MIHATHYMALYVVEVTVLALLAPLRTRLCYGVVKTVQEAPRVEPIVE